MARIRNERLIQAVAVRLKQLREKRGMTLEAVFLDTGIHIARVEAGKANITLSTLEALCAYLGVTLIEFFSDDFPDFQK
ncbi:helix-turn-helix domain-containing protein [Pontibacter pudoricolor]|uniref:helix-turn-helix domain-containing protein n=1 Tax=Pontibacter pudoricolor TaxID=2694930 RepID=UPI001391AA23|nr:helix-turn-helix transcriptional regulator [Pontibacter pudoricolor]